VELKGERLLPAGRATAWDLLNDSEVLKQCVPGCESMTRSGPNTYDVVMTAAIGPVKARFKGKLSLTDIEPPSRYRLLFDGQSAQAGFARGEARVELQEISSQRTKLSYSATAHIGGKLAQIGARLVDAAAGATADKFFQSFAAQLSARVAAEGPGVAPVPAASGSTFWSWLKSFVKHLFSR